MRVRWKPLSVSLLALIAALSTGYGWWRWHYPYGWSHCCDKCLYFGLLRYADEHDGWFPRAAATPEASLSLLYRQDPNNAYVLRGKTVPESVVLEILQRGELLSPESCGWHYVEGLRKDDNPRLALLWDKAGLDHNGGRLGGGGHIVCFVGGSFEHIPASEWEQFLAGQQRLLAEPKLAK